MGAYDNTAKAYSVQGPSNEPAAQPVRILVVDDEEVIAALLRQALVAAGYVVHVASTAAHALREMAVGPYDIALVRYVGASNWPAYRISKALAIADRFGWARFATTQAYYCLSGRDIERELVVLKLRVEPQLIDSVRGYVVRAGGRVLEPSPEGFVVCRTLAAPPRRGTKRFASSSTSGVER